MSREPDWSQHRPNPRFDPYRERVARLIRADEEVGLVLVRVEPYAAPESGRLWWTKWRPSRDMLWLWVIMDGQFSDHVLPDDVAERELRDYADGRFEHAGEYLRAQWMDDEESRRLRSSEFGVGDDEG